MSPILPCSMIAYALAPSPVSIRRSWTSRRRQTWPSIRYSLSPERYNRRVTSTSRAIDWMISSALNSAGASVHRQTGRRRRRMMAVPIPVSRGDRCRGDRCRCGRSRVRPGNAGPVICFSTPLKRNRTSAAAVGLRASLPLKITSSIRSPRMLLALCSPITHVMASATLLLPHPFGPTMAVTPLSKASSERSENDLNPLISRRSRRMTHTPASTSMPAIGLGIWLAGRQADPSARPGITLGLVEGRRRTD